MARKPAARRGLRQALAGLLLLLPAAPAAAAEQAASRPAVTVPPAEVLVMLVRGTLLAVSQANETGNYSVLYGLSGPVLQRSSSPEALAGALANFRAKGINLSPVAVYAPAFAPPPVVNADGLLRLSGSFPTVPFSVRFDLAYAQTPQGWRLEGLGVDAVPAPQPATAAQAAPSPRKSCGIACAQKKKPARKLPPPLLDRSTDPPTTTAY